MDRGFQIFPEQASSIAPQVDAIYFFLLGVSAFFTVGIFIAIVFLAMYYRKSAPRNRDRHVGGKFWILEATWIAIPFALTMVMFGWGASIYVDMRTMPPNAIEIDVVGKQWMWKIQHPQGRSEINELHIPVDRPIKLRMISEDVIHSFYVPDFRVKMDVLPGRYTEMWFDATQQGEFYLFCAEYCGTDHADMAGKVVAMEPAAYAQWLAGGEEQPPVTAGETLFNELRCNTCHYQGNESRCPPLENLFGSTVQLVGGSTAVVDESYLRESILDPTAKMVAGYQPLMPTYAGQLNEEQIFHLIAYIKSLSPKPEPKPEEGAAQ